MYEIKVQLHSFACGYPVIPEPFVEETIISPFNDLSIFVKNQLTMDVWVYFSTLNSIPMIYMSFLMPVTYCFDY